jgi:hypothetical protein
MVPNSDNKSKEEILKCNHLVLKNDGKNKAAKISFTPINRRLKASVTLCNRNITFPSHLAMSSEYCDRSKSFIAFVWENEQEY